MIWSSRFSLNFVQLHLHRYWWTTSTQQLVFHSCCWHTLLDACMFLHMRFLYTERLYEVRYHQHPVLQLQVSWRGVENPCEWPCLWSWWHCCCCGDISELLFLMSAVPLFSLPYLFVFPQPSPEYNNNALRHHMLYLTRFYAMFNSKRKYFLVSDTT